MLCCTGRILEWKVESWHNI
jgi:hypothetical protein